MLAHEIGQLVWAAYHDWRDYLLNPRIKFDSTIVSWDCPDRRRLPQWPTVGDVVSLQEAGDYSFQCEEDGGIFQLYYKVDRNAISEASLGFCSIPSEVASIAGEVEEVGDSALDEGDEKIVPLDAGGVGSDSRVLWLRIDFDPARAQGMLHSTCHMHIAGFELARFIVKGVPSPRQFVEFIFQSVYPEQFRRHRLGDTGDYRDPRRIAEWNRVLDPMSSSPIESSCAHLRMPGA